MKQHSQLTPEVLGELRSNLLSRKKRLSAVMNKLDEASPVHDEARIDDNAASDADAAEETRMITSEVMTAETDQMLKDINSALERMDQGTYGFTDDGKEIPLERLRIDPTAATLVR